MTAVIVICAVLLTAAGVLALVRAERGPSMLDRTIALDILVTVVVAAVALYASVERRTDVVPILVVLSLVGFVGSVTISRFASVEPAGERRVRSREEIALEEAERIRAEEEAEVQRRARRAREADPHEPAVRGPAGDSGAAGPDDDRPDPAGDRPDPDHDRPAHDGGAR